MKDKLYPPCPICLSTEKECEHTKYRRLNKKEMEKYFKMLESKGLAHPLWREKI